MAVKRMFVLKENRGKGNTGAILDDLRKWAQDLGYLKCIPEKGNKMTETITLYEKNGFKRIPTYGQYAGIKNSICFEKEIY